MVASGALESEEGHDRVGWHYLLTTWFVVVVIAQSKCPIIHGHRRLLARRALLCIRSSSSAPLQSVKGAKHVAQGMSTDASCHRLYGTGK